MDILSTLKHERVVSYHGSIEQGCHLYLFVDFMAKVENQIEPNEENFLEKINLVDVHDKWALCMTVIK